MQELDGRLVDFVSRSGLIIAEAARQIRFNDDHDSSRTYRVLGRLCKEGMLKDRHQGKQLRISSASGHKYWVLGPNGQQVTNCPADRTLPPGNRALRTNLACLWPAAFSHDRLYRLETDELAAALGLEKPPYHSIPHFLGRDRSDGGPLVLRAYVTSTDVNGTIREARNQLEAALKSDLRALIESGTYGWMILSETPSKAKDVQDALRRRHGRHPALCDRALFLSRLGPSPATLVDALKRFLE